MYVSFITKTCTQNHKIYNVCKNHLWTSNDSFTKTYVITCILNLQISFLKTLKQLGFDTQN